MRNVDESLAEHELTIGRAFIKLMVDLDQSLALGLTGMHDRLCCWPISLASSIQNTRPGSSTSGIAQTKHHD